MSSFRAVVVRFLHMQSFTFFPFHGVILAAISSELAASRTVTTSMQVLVVDDEIAIVDLVADMLVDEGHSVTTAHDGRSALALLRGGLRPQVVITDVMMPNLDGWGLYQAIRQELGSRIGIIIMSAGKKVALKDPRALFVPKPFSILNLLNALDQLGP